MNTELRMLQEKLPSVHFYGLKLTFSGPSSFKLATSDLTFCNEIVYGQITACDFVFLELVWFR